jgi:cation:H+ antiporter
MILSLALIALGITLLVGGGEALVRGAVGLATIARLTPAVIGLTVVAAGTSVPELAVSGIAAYQGKTDLAVANVFGSNIFNILVIIGLCAIVRPIAFTGNTVRLEYPVLAIVTLLCLAITQDGSFNRLDAVLCLAIYVGFTAYLVSLVREQVSASEAKELKAEVSELETGNQPPRLVISLALVALGVACLAGGAHATVTGASDLARRFGWSERLIGLTIVSAGTGLPEVVASLMSSLRGRSDIAVGNVIGSNLFNTLIIPGVSALFAPLAVAPALIASDGWWMLGATLVLVPFMITGRRVSRLEGAVLLAIYGVYMGLLIATPESP